MARSHSGSGSTYWGGQKEAIDGSLFNAGGIYDQFLSGKPNAGFERAQTNALQQLQNQQASNGTLNTPLGTRLQNDFLMKSTSTAGDKFYEQLGQFMQPAGDKAKSTGALSAFGGKG